MVEQDFDERKYEDGGFTGDGQIAAGMLELGQDATQRRSFLEGQHFIDIEQITSTEQLYQIFREADKMAEIVEMREVYEPLRGRCIVIIFFQPSTRTFFSFKTAATRLGAYVVAEHGMHAYSSSVKGETLEDTIESIWATTSCDAIIMRHPSDDSSRVAIQHSPVPVINAGSGKEQHPTQALLDLYTIQKKLGRVDNLHVALVGDLKNGRTTNSLAKLLAVIDGNTKITFVSPEEVKASPKLIQELENRVEVVQTDNLHDVLPEADVVYMTRVQKEWFKEEGILDVYERIKDHFILTPEMVATMPHGSIVMHPLPRVNEIPTSVDKMEQAAYFHQMRYGLYIRMALLNLILGGKK